jgi:hypothetical protein
METSSQEEQGGKMTSMLTEPAALNILIDSRVEQLRGSRLRRSRSRLARRN